MCHFFRVVPLEDRLCPASYTDILPLEVGEQFTYMPPEPFQAGDRVTITLTVTLPVDFVPLYERASLASVGGGTRVALDDDNRPPYLDATESGAVYEQTFRIIDATPIEPYNGGFNGIVSGYESKFVDGKEIQPPPGNYGGTFTIEVNPEFIVEPPPPPPPERPPEVKPLTPEERAVLLVEAHLLRNAAANALERVDAFIDQEGLEERLDEMIDTFVDANRVGIDIANQVGVAAISGALAFASANFKQADRLEKLAKDPPDSNFQIVAEPAANRPFVIVVPVGADQNVADLAEKYNVLLLNSETAANVAEAMLTSTNRASGALEVGDDHWQRQQLNAVARYASQLVVLSRQETALRNDLAAFLAEQNLPVPDATAAGLAALQAKVAANDLPPALAKIVSKLSDADRNVILAGITAATAPPAGDLINGPELLRSISGTGLALSKTASAGVFAVGADAGSGPVVHVYQPDGTEGITITAFDASFTGGVRVATADVNGDGVPEVIAVPGRGSAPEVQIFDINTGKLVTSFLAFETTFRGGVFVAAGDVDGDGVAEILVSPDVGGGPRVRVLNGDGSSTLADFFAIDDKRFRGGVRIGLGDLDGDGTTDLLAGAGFGGGPRVALFDGKSLRTQADPLKLADDFFVFEPKLRNGVFLAAGDLNADGRADLIAGAGPGGGPRVFAVSGKDLVAGGPLVPLANFFGGDADGRGGVRVATRDLDADGIGDLLVGTGKGPTARLSAYLGWRITPDATPDEFYGVDAFGADSTGGVFVG